MKTAERVLILIMICVIILTIYMFYVSYALK